MKARKWMAILAVALSCSITTKSWGQANQDPRIIGAYVGAVTQHWFSYGNRLAPAAALFGFSIGYNNEGYHQAGLTSGSIFFLGRRYPMTIQMTVPPFPSPSNRNIDFFMSAVFSDLSVGPWEFQGVIPYGKFVEEYLRDVKVTYQAAFTDADDNPFLDNVGGTANSTVAGADPVTWIEAGRVSTQVFRSPTATARIKIRR